MAAASSRAFLLSRFADLSPSHHHHPPPYSHHLLIRPLPPSFSAISKKRQASISVVSCIISGVDGGGVSDDFVSTRRSVSFDREFSVIANMLKKIEPLDTSVISKGVSDSAKDSMKQTISTMLGLLPSDQFSVMVRVSKRPLDRLLSSSLITGYTLWNAEYRIMLMRNFEISPSNDSKRLNPGEDSEPSEAKVEKSECSCDSGMMHCCTEESERLSLQSCLSDLDPEALNYIQQLESELSAAKKELHARKQENMQIEDSRESDNDLLKYLRSLDPGMPKDTRVHAPIDLCADCLVLCALCPRLDAKLLSSLGSHWKQPLYSYGVEVNELSRPSSSEVEEVIRELVQCTSRKFFKEETIETISDSTKDSDMGSQETFPNDNDDFCDTIGTSRDYLAKLLFWCMLLGHHLRGLENRLHLSCAVGLL